jgi:hypothetical protein
VQRLLGESAGMPGREIAVSLPATQKKALLGALDLTGIPGLMSRMTDRAMIETARKLDEMKTRATQVTEHPTTLPWFLPAAAMSVPASYSKGFKDVDEAIEAQTMARLDEQIEAARKDFEQSLQDEYAASRAKISSSDPGTPGEFIDGLAHLHVKSAQGELNQLLGAYLALAALAGGATHKTVREWVESRDPQRQRFNALQQAIKRRMIRQPPPVQIAPGELPEPELITPDLSKV